VSETLIYNRTSADVAYARAHPDNPTPLKGCYNAADLNRVGEWCLTLRDLLATQGYYVTVNAKTDWTMDDWPTETAMETYIGNVQALRAGYTVLPTTPALPASMNNLSFTGANSIEKNIADMLTLLDYMIQQLRPAGTFYAGEGSL
jgi:hypothetical protein